MRKQNLAFYIIVTALFLTTCTGPLDTPSVAGANTGRVLISITGTGAASRTLLPEYGLLIYTVTITKTGETSPVFTQTITEASVAADLDAGSYTVSVSAKNSGDVLVAEGSGTVAVSPGEASPVTIRMASAVSGTGTFEYTVTIPAYPPVKSGVMEFVSLSGGTDPSPVDLSANLTGTVSAGNVSLPAGFYRAVLKVEVLGKRVAKTLVTHISDQATTTAEFNLAIGDFVPSPPAGGSVIYISTQAELAAINDHIGSQAMNYGKNAYVLLNDIALSGTWTPIGSSNDVSATDWPTAFYGYFFGENHRITGLALPSLGTSHCTGLFGAVRKALIQELTVETTTGVLIGVDHEGYYKYYCIGFVMGAVSESELSGITVKWANPTVNITGDRGYTAIGGVAGYVRDSRLRGITVTGVSGSSLSFLAESPTYLYIGGIAGYLQGDTEISESAVSLDFDIPQHDNAYLDLSLGGMVGKNPGTIRQSSYSGALVFSHAGKPFEARTGGIAGVNGGTIETSYAAPVITINAATTNDNIQHVLYTGGLTGQNTGAIRNSYTVCDIGITLTVASDPYKNIYTGGVAGGVAGQVEKCYAAGSLAVSIDNTNNSNIFTGGISAALKASSSAVLFPAITSEGLVSRIIAATWTLTNNIAFNNMLVNGVTLPDAVTDPENDGNGLGKNAAQLASQSTYETGLGWDFDGVWEMGPPSYPYPVLKWQNGEILLPSGFELLMSE